MSDVNFEYILRSTDRVQYEDCGDHLRITVRLPIASGDDIFAAGVREALCDFLGERDAASVLDTVTAAYHDETCYRVFHQHLKGR